MEDKLSPFRMAQAQSNLYDAEAYVSEVKVWFWYLRPYYRDEVALRKPVLDRGG